MLRTAPEKGVFRSLEAQFLIENKIRTFVAKVNPRLMRVDTARRILLLHSTRFMRGKFGWWHPPFKGLQYERAHHQVHL